MYTDYLMDECPQGSVFTKIKLLKYSNGEAEMIATTIRDAEGLRRNVGKKTNSELLEDVQDSQENDELDLDAQESNLERSLRRSKSTIRKKMIEAETDHLLTLTYRANNQDLESCWNDWTKFVRVLKKKYPKIKYIVVAELQKRGAVHFHAAVNCYLHANTVRKYWLSIIGDGNVDLQRKKHNQKVSDLARYLSKYLTKQSKTNIPFKNLYRCSQDIKLNIEIYYLPCTYQLDQVLSGVFKQNGFTIKSYWKSEDNPLFQSQWFATFD